eukprot:SM000050S17040  [mRNA]  locus=s50:496526:496889:- [translate_table: standard]
MQMMKAEVAESSKVDHQQHEIRWRLQRSNGHLNLPRNISAHQGWARWQVPDAGPPCNNPKKEHHDSSSSRVHDANDHGHGERDTLVA